MILALLLAGAPGQPQPCPQDATATCDPQGCSIPDYPVRVFGTEGDNVHITTVACCDTISFGNLQDDCINAADPCNVADATHRCCETNTVLSCKDQNAERDCNLISKRSLPATLCYSMSETECAQATGAYGNRALQFCPLPAKGTNSATTGGIVVGVYLGVTLLGAAIALARRGNV